MNLSSNHVSALADFKEHLVPVSSCNLCGSPERSEWATSDPIVAYQCGSCGLVYHSPQLTDAGREAFYSSGYFELQNDPNDAIARDAMYEVEIAFLEKHIQKGNILDVGCGGGFLLNKFSPQWEKYGIEFDGKAVEHAKTELGLNVQQGEVNSISFPDETFDAIVLRGVIEHFAEPAVMMKHLTPWLKKGGYLYITSTPNVESLCAELYREKWNLFTADHQIHFPKRTIVAFAKELNCELVDSDYFYLETPYAKELQDYRKILTDIKLMEARKENMIGSSPAFYGNMLSLIFKKQ